MYTSGNYNMNDTCSHVLISLMVFLEVTQLFFGDFKLLTLEVSKGTNSNMKEGLGAEEK